MLVPGNNLPCLSGVSSNAIAFFKFSKDVQYYKEHPEERDSLITKRKYVNNDISQVEECLL